MVSYIKMNCEYQYLDKSDLDDIVIAIKRSPWVALHIETTDLIPWRGRIRLLSVAIPDKVWVIDVLKVGPSAMTRLAAALNNPKAFTGAGHPLVLMQEGKYEQKWFWHHYKCLFWPIFDSWRASSLIYNGQGKAHSKEDIFERELGLHPCDYLERLNEPGSKSWSRDDLTLHHFARVAEEAFFQKELYDVLGEKLRIARLRMVAFREFKGVRTEALMECAGFKLDAAAWKALAKRNATEARRLANKLSRLLPHPDGQVALPGLRMGFNLDSGSMVLRSLRRKGIHLKDSSSKTMAMLVKQHPILDDIIKYRKFDVRSRAFGLKYLRHIDPLTQRIHANFFPMTEAGRYACSDPNLQNIPRLIEFRVCFIARPGYKLLVCDLGQIELRLIAQESQDKVLLAVFRSGGDPHAKTASEILRKPECQITAEERELGKVFNYSLIYGISDEGIVVFAKKSHQLTLTISEVKRLRVRFFEVYSGIKRWQQKQIETQMPTGISYTVGGRIRYMAKDAFNAYYNTPIQGGSAEGIKESQWIVTQGLLDLGWENARIVLQVHDELIVEVRDEPSILRSSAKILGGGLKQGMGKILTQVPILAKVAPPADNWAAAKGLLTILPDTDAVASHV